jgi:hypothetical protein
MLSVNLSAREVSRAPSRGFQKSIDECQFSVIDSDQCAVRPKALGRLLALQHARWRFWLVHDRGMQRSAAFTVFDNWAGGFYELAIEVGPPDDDRLERALRAVWTAAGVRGCHVRRDVEPADQTSVTCGLAELEAHGHLYGVVTLPSGADIVCGVVVIRENHGPDWVDFYLPVGALGRVDGRVGAFPFGADGEPTSLLWRRPIDDWLAEVGRLVYEHVDYRMALIGFEAAGEASAADLAEGEAVPSGWAHLVPDADSVRYLPAES